MRINFSGNWDFYVLRAIKNIINALLYLIFKENYKREIYHRIYYKFIQNK